MDAIGALVDRAVMIGSIIATLAFFLCLVIFKAKMPIWKAILIALLCSLLIFIIAVALVIKAYQTQ